MFNEVLKKEYLGTEVSESNRDALTRYFLRISSKEKEHGKDIVQMPLEQLLDTLKSLDIRREETRGHLLSLLRGYYNWVKLNKSDIEIEDAFDTINPSSFGTSDSVRNSMVRDPRHLQEILSDGLDRENYENRSIVVELLFWLIYYGIPFEKINLLEKEHIDFETNTVHVGDEKYQVSEKIAALWRNVIEIKHIEKRNGRATESNSSFTMGFSDCALMDNIYLFRPIVGNKGDSKTPCSSNTLRKMYSSVFEGAERKIIPIRNIYYSGMFYRLYLREINGDEITPETLAMCFGVKYNSPMDMNVKTRKWRTDYEDWKVAFSLV